MAGDSRVDLASPGWSVVLLSSLWLTSSLFVLLTKICCKLIKVARKCLLSGVIWWLSFHWSFPWCKECGRKELCWGEVWRELGGWVQFGEGLVLSALRCIGSFREGVCWFEWLKWSIVSSPCKLLKEGNSTWAATRAVGRTEFSWTSLSG